MFEVFLCTSPAHFPLSGGCHTWLVTNENENFIRYEILFQKNKVKTMGHFHISTGGVFEGLGIIPFTTKLKWKGKIISQFSEQSAKGIIKAIQDSQKNYPHLHKYKILGPNSNTYTQWILNQFPEWEVKLPINAFGKNY